MRVDGYRLESLKKMDNESLEYDFPVMYANEMYFKEINGLMNSYGIVLEALSQNNYDIDAYIKEVKENPMLSTSFRASEFTVSKDEYTQVSGIEVLQDLESKCVGEVYYTTKPKMISFKEDDEEYGYDVMLHVSLGGIDLYLNGSLCFIDDKVQGRKIKAYLD